MSFALDHDYCGVSPSEKEPQTDTQDSDKISLEMEPSPVSVSAVSGPSTSCDTVDLSSLSPAHSTDSGVDAGIDDFLADFASSWKVDDEFGFDADDFKDLEALLNLTDQFEASESTAKDATSNPTLLNPTTKTNVQTGKGTQRVESMDERNRKNAIAARENRQKKKAYLEGLESEVTKLKGENTFLKSRNETMASVIIKLRDELKYLRSVLANQSTISLLLKSVVATPGIVLSSSILHSTENQETDGENKGKKGESQCTTRSRKRKSVEVVEDAPIPARRTRRSTPGGVCLHVSQGKVSLEFCAKCEKQASQTGSK